MTKFIEHIARKRIKKTGRIEAADKQQNIIKLGSQNIQQPPGQHNRASSIGGGFVWANTEVMNMIELPHCLSVKGQHG